MTLDVCSTPGGHVPPPRAAQPAELGQAAELTHGTFDFGFSPSTELVAGSLLLSALAGDGRCSNSLAAKEDGREDGLDGESGANGDGAEVEVRGGSTA